MKAFLLALLVATTLAADTRIVSFAGHPAQIVDMMAYVSVNGAGTITAINVKAQIAQVYSEPSGDTAINQLGFVEFELTKESGPQFADMLVGIVAGKWAAQFPSMPIRERRNDRRSR